MILIESSGKLLHFVQVVMICIESLGTFHYLSLSELPVDFNALQVNSTPTCQTGKGEEEDNQEENIKSC